MPQQIAITFDIDWAPDWAVARCAALCRAHGVPATFFVTHPSPVLADLRRDGFELGLHPNLLPNSSHGVTAEDVLDHCLELVPEARSLRTHALVQSSPFFALIADRYPSIDTDVSLLLPLHPGLKPVDIHMGESNRRITRLPYFWEDDVAAADPAWNWFAPPPAGEGLQIYDFHPIHIALNTGRMDHYRALKSGTVGRPLSSLTEDACAPYVNTAGGAASFLARLMGSAPAASFHTVGALSRAHRGGD